MLVSCYNTAPKFTIGKSLIGVQSLRASGAAVIHRERSAGAVTRPLTPWRTTRVRSISSQARCRAAETLRGGHIRS